MAEKKVMEMSTERTLTDLELDQLLTYESVEEFEQNLIDFYDANYSEDWADPYALIEQEVPGSVGSSAIFLGFRSEKAFQWVGGLIANKLVTVPQLESAAKNFAADLGNAFTIDRTARNLLSETEYSNDPAAITAQVFSGLTIATSLASLGADYLKFKEATVLKEAIVENGLLSSIEFDSDAERENFLAEFEQTADIEAIEKVLKKRLGDEVEKATQVHQEQKEILDQLLQDAFDSSAPAAQDAAEARAVIDSLRGEVDLYNEFVSEFSTAVDDEANAQSALDDVTEQYDSTELEHQAIISQEQAALDALVAEQTEINDRISQLETQISTLSDGSLEHSLAVTELTSAQLDATSIVFDIEEQSQTLMDAKRSSRIALAEAQNLLTAHQETYTRAAERTEALQTQVDALSASAEAHAAAVSTYQTAISELAVSSSETLAQIATQDALVESLNTDVETRKANLNTYNTNAEITSASASGTKAATASTVAGVATSLLTVASAIPSYFAEATSEGGASALSTVGFASTVTQFSLDAIASVADGLGKTKVNGVASGAAAVAASVNASVRIADLSESLNDPDLTAREEFLLKAELGVQSVVLGLGALTGTLAAINVAAKAGTALANSTANAIPVVGALISIASAINPAQWLAFEAADNYIDDVLARDDFSSERLAGVSDTVLDIEKGIYGTSTAISASLGVVAAGLSLTGVGAPVGIVIGLIGAAISGILQGIQQPLIENAINDERNDILDEFGSFSAYFEAALDSQHESVLDAHSEYFASLFENDENLDTIVGLSSHTFSASDIELAGKLRIREETGQTAKHYLDTVERDGQSSREDFVIDPTQANIVLSNADGAQQYLTFLTPLLAPGEEEFSTDQTGKNAYATTIEIIGAGSGWTITDQGDVDTTFDLNRVVTDYQSASDETHLQLGLSIDAGAGDDQLIAYESKIHFDGGEGSDAASYIRLGSEKLERGLSVTSSDGRIYVEKTFKEGTQFYRESIEDATVSAGKRTDTVEYRTVEMATRDETRSATDILTNIESFHATEGSDYLDFGDADSITNIFAFEGDDEITTGNATQFVSGGEGNDVIRLDKVVVDRLANPMAVENGDYVLIDGGEGHDEVRIDAGLAGEVYANGQIESIALALAEANFEGAEATPDAIASLAEAFKANFQHEYAQVFDLTVLQNIESIHTNFNTSSLTQLGSDFFSNGVVNLQDYSNAVDLSFDARISEDTVLDFSKAYGFTNVLQSLVVIGTSEGEGIYGGASDDALFGLDGDDVLTGSLGNDTLDGGAGNDTVDFTRSLFDRSYGGRLFDLALNIVREWGDPDTREEDTLVSIENVVGTFGDDRIFGNDEDNRLEGSDGNDYITDAHPTYGGGNDTLHGGNGNDTLHGGIGNDALAGGNADDVLYGGEGEDLLRGGGSDDDLDGGSGNDTLAGNHGDDSLWGGDGDDLLSGGIGDDTLNGGSGNDTVTFSGVDHQEYSSDGFLIDLALNVARDRNTENSVGEDTLIDIENVIGSSENDRIFGNDEDNRLDRIRWR